MNRAFQLLLHNCLYSYHFSVHHFFHYISQISHQLPHHSFYSLLSQFPSLSSSFVSSSFLVFPCHSILCLLTDSISRFDAHIKKGAGKKGLKYSVDVRLFLNVNGKGPKTWMPSLRKVTYDASSTLEHHMHQNIFGHNKSCDFFSNWGSVVDRVKFHEYPLTYHTTYEGPHILSD